MNLNYLITDLEIINEFNQYMNDDLNTSRVLTLIEEVIKEINKLLLTNDYSVLGNKINALNFILNTLGLSVMINPKVSEGDKKKSF